MKKYFFHLFTILIFHNSAALAVDGVVIVLEAPLLKEPKLSSKVLQTVRKGQKVFIPREEISSSTAPEFYSTFDRAGNPAYIPSRYIKPVTENSLEENTPIALAGYDPTDYRIEEPIPSTYPFANSEYNRASLSFTLGSSTKSPYNYNSDLNRQDYKNEMGARILLTRKVDHDQFDRFYFGIQTYISSAKSVIDFKNLNTVNESRDVIRVGPILTYDAFRTEKLRLSIGTGFTFNYHRSRLFIDGPVLGEERFFSGFSLSPMSNISLEIEEILPTIDLITGVGMNLFLPYSIKANDTPENPELWNEGNQISYGFKAQASAFLGIQASY